MPGCAGLSTTRPREKTSGGSSAAPLSPSLREAMSVASPVLLQHNARCHGSCEHPNPKEPTPNCHGSTPRLHPQGALGTYPPSWLSQHGHLQCHHPTNSACHLPVPRGQRPGCSRALPARSRSREHPLGNAPAAEPFPAPSAQPRPRELRHPPGAGLPRAGAHLPASPMSTASHPRHPLVGRFGAPYRCCRLCAQRTQPGGSALPPELPVQPGVPGGSRMCPRRGLGTAGPRLRREGRAAGGLGLHARGHTPAHSRTHTSACMHTRMHTPACTHTRAHALAHGCMHTHARAHTRRHARSRVQAHGRQRGTGERSRAERKRTENTLQRKRTKSIENEASGELPGP